jgi:hypothetical protein
MLYGLGRCGARMKHQRNPHERCRADPAGKVEGRHERPGASNDGEQRQGGLRIGTPPFSIRNCLALSAAAAPSARNTCSPPQTCFTHDCTIATKRFCKKIQAPPATRPCFPICRPHHIFIV